MSEDGKGTDAEAHTLLTGEQARADMCKLAAVSGCQIKELAGLWMAEQPRAKIVSEAIADPRAASISTCGDELFSETSKT